MRGRMSWTNLAFVLGFVIGGVLYCRHFFHQAPGMIQYAVAAKCLLVGAPLQQCEPSFTYPPFFAFLMIPLAPLPLIVRNAIWYAVTAGGLIACFALAESLARRLFGDDWSPVRLAWWRVLSILLCLKFVFAGIGNQSYDTLVVLLVLLGLNALAGERNASGGAWLAAAAALKATPLLFLPYLVVKRRYLAAAVMALATATFSLLPDLLFGSPGALRGEGGYFVAWLRQVAEPALTDKMGGNPHTFWFAPNPNNYSLRGLVGYFVWEDFPKPFKITLYSVYAVYIAVVAALVLRTPRHPGALALDGSLLLISMLMLSPMTSQSHYVATILPFTVLTATALSGDGRLRLVGIVLTVMVFLLTNASSDDLVGRTISGLANEFRLLTIGTLATLIALAALIKNAPAWRANTDTR